MDVPETLLDALRDVVGTEGWITDATDMEPYQVEERGLWRGTCAMVVRPASTAETAEVVRLCADAGIPVVPQSGRTGLVGGGVPDGGIVVSTNRLNRIRAIDPLNHSMTVESGCVLTDIQRAAEEVGCLFPLSMPSEDRCQIGGCLSTNAGGVAVLRYGTTRELALGLEVVLPDGRTWDGLKYLRKNNTGYDLKDLFIGAEGTLGIVTAAVLKLFPLPRARETALVAAPDPDAILELFSRARKTCADSLSAFEMIPEIAKDFGVKHIAGVVDPFADRHPYYALIELTSPLADGGLRHALDSILVEATKDSVVRDAVIADNETQRQELWCIRDSVPLSQKHEGGSIKHDISVPVSRFAEFVSRATALVEPVIPGVRVVAFGHVGDGNIHFNLSQPVDSDKDAFMAHKKEINRLVHDLAVEMQGSFSAEHGIGQLKRAELDLYKPDVEMDVMRRIKAMLDPKSIMNPGKVL